MRAFLSEVWDDGSLYTLTLLYTGVTLFWALSLALAMAESFQSYALWLLPTGGFLLNVVVGSFAWRELARRVWREPRDCAAGEMCYHTEEIRGEVPMDAALTARVATQQSVFAVLATHPARARHLEEMVEWEESHPFSSDWDGWTWANVHTQPAICNQLVAAGLLNLIYQSRSTTHYRLASACDVREALEMARSDLRPVDASPVHPESLFRLVIGQDRAKTLLRYALGANDPVHVLLTGPPGTAKTLLVQDVGHLPGAEFYAGNTTTKAGLVNLLLQAKPRYLVIDEIDKMATEDMTPLLQLMEGGFVMVLQFKKQIRLQLPTQVFATSNIPGKLSAPILSRFLKVEVPPYTPTEFVQVSYGCLTQLEGLTPDLAKAIVAAVVPHSLDIRDAVRVGRMARSHPTDVAAIVRAMFVGRRTDNLTVLNGVEVQR